MSGLNNNSAAPKLASRQKSKDTKVHVYQGSFEVSGREDHVLTTLLGSCVAVCLHDPIAKVGGMNHFLVPGDKNPQESLSQGAYSMELLINGVLKLGAARPRMVAKLFGGATVVNGLSDIGARNGRFAADFLTRERIQIVSDSLGGDAARRIQFWPTSGRARQLLVPIDESIVTQEIQQTEAPAAGNDVELF